MYKDGLARFATDDYVKAANEDNLFMHLTNYAINKESEKFQANESDFKKTLISTMNLIGEIEGEDKLAKLWQEIKEIMVKTLLIGWPHLDHNYKTCSSRSAYQNNR